MSFTTGAAGAGAIETRIAAVSRSSCEISGHAGDAGGGGRARALALLRERVARIEGTQLHRLEEPPAVAPFSGAAEASIMGPDRFHAPVHQGERAGRRTRRVMPFGHRDADAALSGGFPAEGLTEIHVDETRGSGIGAGFVLSLAVLLSAGARRPALWIGDGLAFSEAGFPYLPGLLAHGLDPGALLVVKAGKLEQALWAGEEAARSAALSLVILEVRGNPGRLSLEGTRRLHFRAREAGTPLVLLRQGGKAESTAAPFRLRLASGPAAAASGRPDDRLIGPPVICVRVEKSPAGRPRSFLLEWNPHERRFQEPRPVRACPSAALSDHGRLPAASVDRPDPAREARPLVAFRRAS